MDEPENERKTIIFTSTKRTADEITRYLRQDGFPALAIHGDKAQNERDWVLNQFRTGGHPIMVATDVASRGIGKREWDGDYRHDGDGDDDDDDDGDKVEGKGERDYTVYDVEGLCSHICLLSFSFSSFFSLCHNHWLFVYFLWTGYKRGIVALEPKRTATNLHLHVYLSKQVGMFYMS